MNGWPGTGRPPAGPLFSSARITLLAACATVPAACGGASGDGASEAAYAAESRVVGDWLAEAGLLVLSRAGDRPQLRAASDPTLVVWRRDDPLPAIESSSPIGSHAVVFRTLRGQTFFWDLSQERASALSEVEADAQWQASESAATFWSGARIEVAEEAGARRYEAPGPVLWAAPAPDEGVVALIERQGDRALVSLDESSEPVGELALDVAAPGMLAAWGRNALFLSMDGRELVVVRIPELQETARHAFRRPVTAYAVSGSTHEIYVALANGRIEAVHRLSGERRELARLEGEISELRPGMYGQQLLAFGPEGAFWVSLTGGRSVRLPVDWRSDLPLGLPSGLVLAARGDSLFLVRIDRKSAGEARLEPLDGPARAWWLPLRRSPVVARVATAERGVAGGVEAPPEPSAARTEPFRRAPGDGSEVGAEQPADLEAAGGLPATGAAGPPVDSLGLAFAPPAAGYYAVAVASRTADGVIELVGTLARSGYPTAVQRRRDDGGQMWYRALVGPYPTRDGADAAARQLRRERSLDAWVMELTAGGEGEF